MTIRYLLSVILIMTTSYFINAFPAILREKIPGDTITYISFPELSLSISRFQIWDADGQTGQIQKDTVYLYAQTGETIEGQQIAISTGLLTNLKVEMRYETSVSISNEGPHCDLKEWKHFYSGWKPLKSDDKGHFVGAVYTEAEREKFRRIDMKELKEKVKEECGKQWFDLVKDIRSVKEHPSRAGISRYFLRISGQRKDNGQKVTKIIIIEAPMGC